MSRSQRNNRKQRKKLRVFVDKHHQVFTTEITPEVRELFRDNQRAINRVENPKQNLVDDTNKLLENYLYSQIDNDTLYSLRDALYKMIEAWKQEGLIKHDFDSKSYVNMILDKIKSQVPEWMRSGLISA